MARPRAASAMDQTANLMEHLMARPRLVQVKIKSPTPTPRHRAAVRLHMMAVRLHLVATPRLGVRLQLMVQICGLSWRATLEASMARPRAADLMGHLMAIPRVMRLRLLILRWKMWQWMRRLRWKL